METQIDPHMQPALLIIRITIDDTSEQLEIVMDTIQFTSARNVWLELITSIPTHLAWILP